MKYRILYTLLFLACTFMMPACTDNSDEGGNDTPPAGALPSDEFDLNTLPDEPYAEDAIRIVAEGDNAPFISLELIGDGYYLLTFEPYSDPSYFSETGRAQRKGALRKSHTAIRTRGTWDENGTLTSIEEGLQYGRFKRLGDKKYALSNGVEIDLQNASGSNGTVTYKSSVDGRISTVHINVFKPTVTNATKSLCHSWENNNFEFWAYWNGVYMAHGKQAYNDGKVESYFEAVPGLGLSQDDFSAPEEYCYKSVFTNSSENNNGGTYICFYLDGDWQVTNWDWEDEKRGTLHWYDEYDDAHCTIRFAGNQMRVYEDYSYYEESEEIRFVAVTTLTAIK